MKISYVAHNLRFRHPFTISKGTKTHQPTLVVELEFMGVRGYGEAPAITYYDITVEKMIADLERKKMFIEKFAYTDPERYWHYLHHLLPMNPFLVCAIDIASWDLHGKLKNKQLYELWGGDPSHNPMTDFTIGIDTPEKMLFKMQEQPWPIYKIKVGTADDLAIVENLRRHTDAILRVDANAGWDLPTAMQLIPELEKLGVELVEQPLAKDDWDGMKTLYAASALPLIADESCVSEHDVAKCAGFFHGVNIKLTKCSGITPARRMITEARKSGLKVMVGSMNESTVGSAAIAHLLPFIDYVDMDGPLLQSEDLATGIGYNQGKIQYSGRPGLGIEYTGLFEKIPS